MTRRLGAFGVELTGIDPVGAPAHAARRLRDLVARHRVVVARLADPLSPRQLVDLGRRLGPLISDPTRRGAADPPELIRVVTDERGGRPAPGAGWPAAGLPWHQDHSFLPEPAALSVLVPAELPPDGSGTTSFVDLTGALDALDEPDRRRLVRSTVVSELAAHLAATFGVTAGRLRAPLVVDHPDLGVAVPWLGPEHGRIEEEGDEVPGRREELVAVIVDRCPRLDHAWRPGDLVVFDNLAVLHGRGPVTTSHRREMWQVSTRMVGGVVGAAWTRADDAGAG